jgi:hypothetical protein
MKVTSVVVIASLVLFGCATVHQPPGIDSEMMKKFEPSTDTNATADSLVSQVKFDLSIEEAVNAIVDACYDLEIPLYYPLINRNKEKAWLVSGPFIAQCGRDCDCGKVTFAWGHGSEIASGTISIKLLGIFSGESQQVDIEISSMFFRTQSTSGEYGSTSNLYFNSLGRIENVILESLAEAQDNKS